MSHGKPLKGGSNPQVQDVWEDMYFADHAEHIIMHAFEGTNQSHLLRAANLARTSALEKK